ncbi:MAG: hypothetical protein KDD78_04400, partial [Caldilineaceae bacterium]|nr:hypothetical protein [Caldilineaceae bacterium]
PLFLTRAKAAGRLPAAAPVIYLPPDYFCTSGQVSSGVSNLLNPTHFIGIDQMNPSGKRSSQNGAALVTQLRHSLFHNLVAAISRRRWTQNRKSGRGLSRKRSV